MKLIIDLRDTSDIKLAISHLTSLLSVKLAPGVTTEPEDVNVVLDRLDSSAAIAKHFGVPEVTSVAQILADVASDLDGASTEMTTEQAVAYAESIFGGPAVVPLPPAPTHVAVVPPPTVPAPTPATSVPVPAATAVPTPPLAAATQGHAPGAKPDIRGLPWDERIHSSTRAVNADGTWRTKRGVDKDLVKQIEAQIGGATAASIPVVLAPAPPAPPIPNGDTGGLTFPQVCVRVQNALTGGTITQAQLQQAVTDLDLKSFAELAKRPDYFATVLTALGV